MACPACRKHVSTFSQHRKAVQNLKDALPPDLDWDSLSEEMAGNIRVGLAAGEAIAAFDHPAKRDNPKPHWLGWTAAWVMTATSAVLVTALWLNLPGPQADHLLAALRSIRFERVGKLVQPVAATSSADDVLVEASTGSIQVRQNGGSLSLLHPRSDGLTISVNMQGSAGARYIDTDTGQVTINRVYYAQQ
jgi:hypothetical protein